MNLLSRHRCSQGESGGKRRPPIEMPPMIKVITTMSYFVSVSFSIFAYTTVCEYNRLILTLTTRWPEPLEIKIFAIQFKRIT